MKLYWLIEKDLHETDLDRALTIALENAEYIYSKTPLLSVFTGLKWDTLDVIFENISDEAKSMYLDSLLIDFDDVSEAFESIKILYGTGFKAFNREKVDYNLFFFNNKLKNLLYNNKNKEEYVRKIEDIINFINIYLGVSNNEYDMKYHRGSFLDEGFDNKMKEWGIEEFDIVMGNFPYQKKVGVKKTQSLWNIFVKKSISILNEDYGYLVNVHPSGWRNVDGNYKDVQLLLKNNLIYLEMHNDKDGQEVFGATTSYDWYCFSKYKVKSTIVKDQNGNKQYIDLSVMEFIPNGEFDLFNKLIAKEGEERVELLYNRSMYGTDKKHMSKEKFEKYKYPCVYTITKDKTINLYWSNQKNEHFGISKIIWSNGMASPATIDKDGKYGLTQFAYAIVDDVENLENIKKAMDSEKFINLMKLCYMSSGNRFDRKVLSTFKKDFWKEFLNE